jgi:DNA repair photolyase
MQHKQINCDSLLKKITKKDILFNGTYSIDPFQNCEFGCQYCDSSFEKTIYIKKNAAEVLESEMRDARKGIIIIGSVHDPYQKAERKHQITQEILKVINKYDFPCHILTKSILILRDIDLLSSMNCTITLSIISLNQNITNIFEKNVPTPHDRLQTIQKYAKNGCKTGVALIPIIPYITEKEFESIIKSAKEYDAQYLLFKHLELKGEQKLFFQEIIQKNYPQLVFTINELYKNSFFPEKKYKLKVDKKIQTLCKKYKLLTTIRK